MQCYTAPEDRRKNCGITKFPKVHDHFMRMNEQPAVKALLAHAGRHMKMWLIIVVILVGALVAPAAHLYWNDTLGVRTGVPRFLPAQYEKNDLTGKAFRDARLPHANFRGATLREAEFSNAHLRFADFTMAGISDADFTNALFDGATCHYTNFSCCTLAGASFRGSDCRDADFSNADLRNAEFTNADLRGAKMDGANTAGAIFANARMK